MASAVEAAPGVPSRLYTDYSPEAVDTARLRNGTVSFTYDHGGEHAGLVEAVEWYSDGEMIAIVRINPNTEGGQKFLDAEETRLAVSKEFLPVAGGLERLATPDGRSMRMTKWDFLGLASVDGPALLDAVPAETLIFGLTDKLATTEKVYFESMVKSLPEVAQVDEMMTLEQQSSAMAMAENFGVEASKFALKAIKEKMSYEKFVEELTTFVENYDDDDDMDDDDKDEKGKKKMEDADSGKEDAQTVSDSTKIAQHGQRVGMGEMASKYIAEGKSYVEFAEAVITEKAKTTNVQVDPLSAQVETHRGEEIFNTSAYIKAMLRPGNPDLRRRAAYELDFAKEANKDVMSENAFVIPWNANIKYGKTVTNHSDLLDLADRGIITEKQHKAYTEQLTVAASGFVTTVVDMGRAEAALQDESVVMQYIETSTGHQMNENIPVGSGSVDIELRGEGLIPEESTPTYVPYVLTPKTLSAKTNVTQLLDIQTLGAGSRMVVMDLVNVAARTLDQVVLLGKSDDVDGVTTTIPGIPGTAGVNTTTEANLAAVDFQTILAMEKDVMDNRAPLMSNMVTFFNNAAWQGLRSKLEVPGARDSVRVIEVSGWGAGTTSTGTQPAHRASVIPNAVGASSIWAVMGRFDTVRLPMWGPGIQIVASNFDTITYQTFEIVMYADVGLPRGNQFSILRVTA